VHKPFHVRYNGGVFLDLRLAGAPSPAPCASNGLMLALVLVLALELALVLALVLVLVLQEGNLSRKLHVGACPRQFSRNDEELEGLWAQGPEVSS
jgi:hypothetical protein